MGWSRIPKMEGIRAGKHWLETLEPSKEAKRRRQFSEFRRKIEAALGHDKKLTGMFQATIEMARMLGRTEGLREGLELYQYGLKYEGKSPATRAVMKYVVSNAGNPDKLTTKEICAHLDRELERIRAQKTAEASIRPPEAWGCEDWGDAREKKRNDVDVLFSGAKEEALSQTFNTLMAWATWGEKSKRKARGDPAKPNRIE